MQEIDALIDKFKSADDENYTLFTYVNELNQEVAALEEHVRAIEAEAAAAAATASTSSAARNSQRAVVRIRDS